MTLGVAPAVLGKSRLSWREAIDRRLMAIALFR